MTTRQYWQVKLDNNDIKVKIKFIKLGHSRKGFPCSGSNYYKVKNEYSYSGKYDDKTKSYALIMKGNKLSDSTCGDISKFPKKLTIAPLPGKRFLVKDDNRKNYVIHHHTVKGTWYWLNESGNTSASENIVEKEIWQLDKQKGNKVSGHYYRYVYRKSLNKRKYKCNGKDHIVLFSYFELEGKVLQNGKIMIKEKKFFLPGEELCEPRNSRNTDQFTGILIGDKLILKSDRSGSKQQLIKRSGL